MDVYVVTQTNYGEDHVVIGVFTDKKEAAEIARSRDTDYDEGHIHGPFHVIQELPTCIECPECGAEVDTRKARAL